MNLDKLESVINDSFEVKEKIGPKSDKKLLKAINETINLVDAGKIRVANKVNGTWVVNQWIKNDEPWAAKFSDEDFINYKIDNLAKFLKEINELR